jgi:sugar/nucleoside kinase (ribokinase family)
VTPTGGHRALPGGSPFNVAVGLGRLGVPTGLLGAISDDEHGTLLAARLADAGVRILPARAPHGRRRSRRSRSTRRARVLHLLPRRHERDRHGSDDDVAAAVAEAPGTASAALHVSLGAVTLASPGTGRCSPGCSRTPHRDRS